MSRRSASTLSSSTAGAADDPVWPDTWFEPEASGSIRQPADKGLPSWPDSLSRVARVYTHARVGLASALLLLQTLLTLTGTPLPHALWWLTGSYAFFTLGVAWVTSSRASPLRLATLSPAWSWLTVGVDLFHFAAIDLHAPSGLIATPLMALPVLMAGVFWPRVEALGTAAGVALFLLFRSFYAGLGGEAAALLHARAGMAGLAVMAIAWFGHGATRRLLMLEQQGRDSQALAHQQAQIRHLVIDELDQGVLVVDRRGRLRALNPAAATLLGLPDASPKWGFGLSDELVWQPLAEAVEQGYAQGTWPEAGRLVCLAIGDRSVRLIVRLRFTRAPGGDSLPSEPEGSDLDLCVLLLEDERVVQARIQQEKLAAMGRMSAGMAHDIRNPLAAISQASALLGEEPLPPGSDRLVKIIDTQVERLSRLVNDVLDAAVSTPGDAGSLDLLAGLTGILRDWTQAKGLPLSVCGLRVGVNAAVVRFDHEHLRRVLVNLLDNAWQHGRGRPGSVCLTVTPGSDLNGVVLTVWNDGARLTPEVEARLFEPFFSTRAQGTGLGLFLSRELCQRHGASLRLSAEAPSSEHTVGFAITFMPLT